MDINWDTIGNEVIEHLRNIIRLDTRNPPGNETLAAEYLRTVLEAEGIECTIVGPHPDRGTLVARLHGDGSEKPLLLMSHTDVVAVDPEKWTYGPFSGDIADGYIYGRGTQDMKHMVTMELMVMLLPKRSGLPLKRDVIYMAAADEETGGYQGAGWIVEHYPQLIDAEYALNEGGGEAMEIHGQRYYTVQTAEKGLGRFRLRAAGRPGHGSVPHDDNAVLKLASLLLKLEHAQTPFHYTDTVTAYLKGIASHQPREVAQAFLDVLASEDTVESAICKLPVDENFKGRLRAQLRNTATPTILQAGTQINVIPSEAEAHFDARLLPGWGEEEFLAELKEIFGEEANIEFIEVPSPQEVDPASPLFDLIKDVVTQYDPEAAVIPYLITGGTDGEHVAKLGTKIYGFAPQIYIPGEDSESGVHGHDERIHTSALQWGTQILYEVVAQFVKQQ